MLAGYLPPLDCAQSSPTGALSPSPSPSPGLQRATLRLSDHMVVSLTPTLQPWAGPGSVGTMKSNANFQILNKGLCKL